MLICSACQFRNPSHNNFCQQCGDSLLQQTCPQCGSDVAFTQINCSACGAQVGKLWLAILTPGMVDISLVAGPIVPQLANLSIAAVNSELTAHGEESVVAGLTSTGFGEFPPEDITVPLLLPQTATITSPFLDAQQRYQVLGPLEIAATTELGKELEGPVLDCAPLQLTAVETLVEEMQLLSKTEDFAEPVTAAAYLAQGGNIPEIAYPYLALQPQFPQTIPRLQNAWWQPIAEANETGMVPSQQVLILPDHSGLPELLFAWQQDQVPMLQLLRWLEDMLDLWVALEPWGYCHSLLKLNNLRINQNRFLCLRRLYYQDTDISEPGLALANVWRTLFNLALPLRQRDLAPLGRELAQRSVQSLADLELLLADVVCELQQTCPESWSALTAAAGDHGFPHSSATLNAAKTMPPKNSGGDSPTAILPYQLQNLESAALTDVGRDRQQNEDYFLVQERSNLIINPHGRQLHNQGLYILCDGMGGHAEGEVASSLAACGFYQHLKANWQDQLPDEALLLEAVGVANQAIYKINEEKSRAGSGRMGTTLVAALVQDTLVRVVHVGDSRLYCYSESRGLEQLTTDHEVGQREIRRGVDPEKAYSRLDAYQLTQALGPKNALFVQPDVQSFEVTEDSLLLLCSDGLSDHELLENYALAEFPSLLNSAANLQQGVQSLIDLANRYNGHDNITAIAVRLQVRVQRLSQSG